MSGPFFAELTYNTTRNIILYAESFGPEEQEKLEDYALSVRLPDAPPQPLLTLGRFVVLTEPAT